MKRRLPTKYRRAFGRALKRIRGKRSQIDFAADLGLGQPHYSAIERGSLEPSLALLVLLLLTHGLSIDKVIKEVDKREKTSATAA